jgi:serine/threonine protein kinase
MQQSCRLLAYHPFTPASATALLLLLLLLPGRGAYGSVYKALDRSSGQIVAIKVISTTDSDEDDLTRIHKEVRHSNSHAQHVHAPATAAAGCRYTHPQGGACSTT